jgi:hypothetical protein
MGLDSPHNAVDPATGAVKKQLVDQQRVKLLTEEEQQWKTFN